MICVNQDVQQVPPAFIRSGGILQMPGTSGETVTWKWLERLQQLMVKQYECLRLEMLTSSLDEGG